MVHDHLTERYVYPCQASTKLEKAKSSSYTSENQLRALENKLEQAMAEIRRMQKLAAELDAEKTAYSGLYKQEATTCAG